MTTCSKQTLHYILHYYINYPQNTRSKTTKKLSTWLPPTWLSSIERWLVEPVWRTHIGQLVNNVSVQFGWVAWTVQSERTESSVHFSPVQFISFAHVRAVWQSNEWASTERVNKVACCSLRFHRDYPRYEQIPRAAVTLKCPPWKIRRGENFSRHCFVSAPVCLSSQRQINREKKGASTLTRRYNPPASNETASAAISTAHICWFPLLRVSCLLYANGKDVSNF